MGEQTGVSVGLRGKSEERNYAREEREGIKEDGRKIKKKIGLRDDEVVNILTSSFNM